MTILVISLTPKGGIASTRPGIMCSEIGTVLPCLCNGPYTPSEGSCTDVHLGHNKCGGNKIEFSDVCYGPSVLHSEM